jgi:hypothetical protein
MPSESGLEARTDDELEQLLKLGKMLDIPWGDTGVTLARTLLRVRDR